MEKRIRTSILGVQYDVVRFDETADAVCAAHDALRGAYICVGNVHTTVMAHDDPAFLAAENGAYRMLPDGRPISILQRKRGFREAEQVTGPDLMGAILARSAENGYTHFFYGSTVETQNKLCGRLRARYPGICVLGGEPSVFRPLTEEENDALVRRINALRPDFVWVGLGAPRQELFMQHNCGRVDAIMLGVGGAFDVYADNVKRAPVWMQRMCLEGLYRLLQEPKRLFKRYLVTNTRFLYLLWKERGA